MCLTVFDISVSISELRYILHVYFSLIANCTFGYVGLLKSCIFPWPGSQASLFLESVEGFCAPAGAQKPSTLSNERAAGAQKIVTQRLVKSLVEHSPCDS